jgi:hypothetical protein
MKRLTAALAALTLAACGGKVDEEDFKSGLPTQETVALSFPTASGSQALSSRVGSRQDALQGEKALFYTVTRAVTGVVNGATGFVLLVLKEVVSHPATSIQGNVAVWGPHTRPLDANAWKLTVTDTGNDVYTYKLEAKGKNEDDSTFRVVLSGSHKVARDANNQRLVGYGEGSFLADWNAASTLPDHDDAVGTGEFTYSRKSATDATTIGVALRQVKGADGKLVDADYAYVSTPGQGGEFQFSALAEASSAVTPAGMLSIKSRWTEEGAGRADVKAAGENLTPPATLSECWDSGFLSTYLNTSFAPSLNYGIEADACSFDTAVYASL